MIGHPWRSTLLGFDTGELSPRRRARVAGHLRDCVACRGRLADLRGLRERVRNATALTPPDALAVVLDRAGAGESLILPVPGTAATPAPRSRWWTSGWAAAVMFMLSVGSVAAAIGAGRPVARWIRERFTEAPRADPAPAAPIPRVGIDVEVPPEGLDIELMNAGPDLVVRVEHTDAELLELLGLGGASLARFRAGGRRVVVTGAAAGELRIGLPRGAGRVRLLADGRTLLVLEAADEGGREQAAFELRFGDLQGAATAP